MKVSFDIIFQKLFDVISFCKNLFFSKFPLKTVAAETSQENSLLNNLLTYIILNK